MMGVCTSEIPWKIGCNPVSAGIAIRTQYHEYFLSTLPLHNCMVAHQELGTFNLDFIGICASSEAEFLC
jgi:hypothetical protein